MKRLIFYIFSMLLFTLDGGTQTNLPEIVDVITSHDNDVAKINDYIAILVDAKGNYITGRKRVWLEFSLDSNFTNSPSNHYFPVVNTIYLEDSLHNYSERDMFVEIFSIWDFLESNIYSRYGKSIAHGDIMYLDSTLAQVQQDNTQGFYLYFRLVHEDNSFSDSNRMLILPTNSEDLDLAELRFTVAGKISILGSEPNFSASARIYYSKHNQSDFYKKNLLDNISSTAFQAIENPNELVILDDLDSELVSIIDNEVSPFVKLYANHVKGWLQWQRENSIWRQ